MSFNDISQTSDISAPEGDPSRIPQWKSPPLAWIKGCVRFLSRKWRFYNVMKMFAFRQHLKKSCVVVFQTAVFLEFEDWACKPGINLIKTERKLRNVLEVTVWIRQYKRVENEGERGVCWHVCLQSSLCPLVHSSHLHTLDDSSRWCRDRSTGSRTAQHTPSSSLSGNRCREETEDMWHSP